MFLSTLSKKTKQSLNYDWYLESTSLAFFSATIKMTSYLSDSFPSALVGFLLLGRDTMNPATLIKKKNI